MLRGIVKSTVYVRISVNEIAVRHIESGREIHCRSQAPFSTRRLLVGDFLAANRCLTQALKEVNYGPAYFAAPRVLMHPVEMVDGGLSPVEERVLHELATMAGGRKTRIWVGRSLTDQEVAEQVNAA